MMRRFCTNSSQVVRSASALLMRSSAVPGGALLPHLATTAPFSSAAQQQTSGVYVIFGATGGIGSALVERLAGAGGGLKLVLVGQEEGPLQQLQQRTPGSVIISADATNSQQVQRVFDEVKKKHAGGSPLLGVASLVGNVVAHSGLATSDSDLDATLRVNLVSAFHITKEAGKALLAGGQGGSIVLTSAAVAEQGIPNFEAMSAAKAGVEGLARSFAASFAAHGIRVNCVAPGLTATGQAAPLMRSGGAKAASEQMHPEKRIAGPPGIASALEFFLRPENDMVTGQVLAVDGGLSTLAPHKQQDYQQGK
jgi:NAD(P)-dependent dehydrogenase (short-subunit alcohol dehydrogenase family)